MGNSTNLKQRQRMSLQQKLAIGIGGGSLLIFAFVFVFLKFGNTDQVSASTICGSEIVSEEIVVSNVSCSGNVAVKSSGSLVIDADVVISGELTIEGGGSLLVKDGASLTLGNLKMDGTSSSIEVEAGAWLFTDAAQIQKGTFTNNGYVEHTSSTQNFTLKKSMQGTGIFYCIQKTKVKLTGGAKLLNKKIGALSDDKFILSSSVITSKRLPKFKVDQDSLELGDSLVVEDTLDLNGKNIDIKNFNFKLPKSFSYHRNGDNSEYIKTSSGGKYKMPILANNVQHVAPIGRNPYLPVTAECADCEGTEFAVAVTQDVYLNPDDLSGIQNNNAVGETWSVLPDKNINGTVSFEIQWNAGANGTTNSELSGFNRASATTYYWIKGQSTQWQTDGVNVGVAVTGADPYIMTITFSGMQGGKEYLFSVGSAGTALPVEFSNFDATLKGNQVELKWTTESEENNDFFTVQRSADLVTWFDIAEVKGAGTTFEKNSYVAYDNAPFNGLSYYRIKQTDYNGNYDFSAVRKMAFSENTSDEIEILSVFPNPFNSQLTVQLKIPLDGNYQIQLLSLDGQLVHSDNIETKSGNFTHLINGLSALKSGNYMLLVVGNGKKASARLSKSQ